MSSALTVHNAEIKTATVEIRTLAISGKQVTLAVFRQLREELLIAQDGSLNGVPWGVVNYHPDKCGGRDFLDHWHVVWQQGTELLRSSVIKEPAWRAFYPNAGPAFLSAHVRDVLLGVESRHFEGEIPEWDNALELELCGINVAIRPSRAARAATQAWRELRAAAAVGEVSSGRYVEYCHEKGFLTSAPWFEAKPLLERRQAEALDALVLEVGPQKDAPDVLFAKFESAVQKEAARQRRHLDQRHALAALPQLFIAV